MIQNGHNPGKAMLSEGAVKHAFEEAKQLSSTHTNPLPHTGKEGKHLGLIKAIAMVEVYYSTYKPQQRKRRNDKCTEMGMLAYLTHGIPVHS